MSNKLLAGAALVSLAFCAGAQQVPLSYAASPDVYKLLAEDANFRVVLATWKPGQKDTQHSHAALSAYRLTDCTSRIYGADGKPVGEGTAKAGSVALQGLTDSHSVENIGTADCRILIVERK